LTRSEESSFLAARRAAGYTSLLTLRGLLPLLGYLRGLGVVPDPPERVTNSPLEELLGDYRGYLLRERGMAAGSVQGYESAARRFLSKRARGGELELEGLVAAEITRFVHSECRDGHVRGAKILVSALRSLLHYLYLEGRTARQLASVVPAVAGWRASSLPQGLEPEQVARLLAICDRRTAVGSRDYAILLLLVRLGLRAQEVTSLDLEDLDWRAGEVVVRGKGRREERLPLSVDVGEAVADYLLHSRPCSWCTRLFLRVRAPHHELTKEGIGDVVRWACVRAGLPKIGPHRLRHTAATAMLRAGVRLPEVSQVLRHRSLSTTAIYAKVDDKQLRSLARQWPGGTA
jgi:integrase/recombinase XerD